MQNYSLNKILDQLIYRPKSSQSMQNEMKDSAYSQTIISRTKSAQEKLH